MDYLDRYLQVRRTRAGIDTELVIKWRFHIEYQGAKPVKDEMAKVRRAATTIKSLARKFDDTGSAERQKLNDAARALEALASKLEPLAQWAEGYFKFYQAERERERMQALDDAIAKRWLSDATADFECALMLEVCSAAGRLELARWFQSRGEYDQVPEDNFYLPFSRPAGHNLTAQDLRRWAMRQLQEHTGAFSEVTTLNWNEKHCHVGMADYARYLSHRKDIAAAAQAVLSRAMASR